MSAGRLAASVNSEMDNGRSWSVPNLPSGKRLMPERKSGGRGPVRI